jgi:hypothetical protein
MRKTLTSADFIDAAELIRFLQSMVDEAPRGSVISVQDNYGVVFGKVALEEQTLTDGSKVHNIILSE